MKLNQIHNVKYLKERRRQLRNYSTSAEVALWVLLKKKKLYGRKFRRQHSIENFIVDFYCASEKLIIEVDGSVHDNLGQSNSDYFRDERLRHMGFKVFRIVNDAVFRHPEAVLEYISLQFNSNHPLPPP